MEPQPAGSPLLLYDGACGLCHATVRFVLRHDRRGTIRFAALQGEAARGALAPLGGAPQELATFVLIEDHGGRAPRRLERSRAALAVARALGGPWGAMANLVGALPEAWLDRAYDAVALRRERFFGRRDACVRPTAAEAERFLDGRADGLAPGPASMPE